jgi:transmembrane sensor
MARERKPANEEMPSRASEWLIALNEEPGNDGLRAQFERWLAANPDHARDWAEMSHTSHVLGSAPPLHQHEWGAFVRQRQVARAADRRGPVPARRRALVRGAMAVAIATCLAFFFFGGHLLLQVEADHATATGEQRSVQLADGTTVVLGADSAIDVAYTDAMRRVRLLKGGAYFTVAADRQRPFSIEAREVEARDIGTAFDVRLEARAVGIAVRNGIVDVSLRRTNASDAERLEAGDWVRVTQAGRIERGRMAADQVAAWTQGQLVVKNRSVAEVVDALRPYYGGFVILRGATLEAQPLTGVYNLADPVEALRAVARAQGATLHRISPWIVLISGD